MNANNLKIIVLDSFSKAEVLEKLGFSKTSGNYRKLNKLIASHNISTEHFTKMPEHKLRDAVKVSCSVAEAIKTMGLVPAGGNYETFYTYVNKYDIDTSHFTGMAWSKGKKRPELSNPRPLDEILITNKITNTSHLRQRLIKENVLPHKCNNCHLVKWLDNPIPLELDHINGIRSDNRIENLQLLCPNCHALTSTYRGRNKGVYANRKSTNS